MTICFKKSVWVGTTPANPNTSIRFDILNSDDSVAMSTNLTWEKKMLALKYDNLLYDPTI